MSRIPSFATIDPFDGMTADNPGNYPGQESRGYRWPFGPVAIIAPFNFPLEIPALQLMGALFMGNKPLIKSVTTVCVVTESATRELGNSGIRVIGCKFFRGNAYA